MPQLNRRQISLRTPVWERASRLRDELAAASGRKVTISDTIDQGLGCLEDAASRGAWLSPKEAGTVLEERLRKEIVSVLAQFIARTMRDREIRGVRFEKLSPGGGVLYVHLDDNVVPLFTGAAEVVEPTERGSPPAIIATTHDPDKGRGCVDLTLEDSEGGADG